MEGHGSDPHHHRLNGDMVHEFVDPVCGMKTKDQAQFIKHEPEFGFSGRQRPEVKDSQGRIKDPILIDIS